MKILVTGAGGFVGGIIATELQGRGGYDVIGIYRSRQPDHQHPAITWAQADLRNGVPLDGGVDYIVHCAAVQDHRGMPIREFIDANLAMTENLARHGRKTGIKGFVFLSSISLHGEIRGDVVDEHTDRINPTPYGESKHLCELLLREYHDAFPVAALRLCGVGGRGAKHIWLARVLAQARRGEDIGIVNADRPFNNIVHTDDLCALLGTLLRRGFDGFQAFPIASRATLPVQEVVAEIVRAVSSPSKIIDNGRTVNSFIVSNDYAMNRYGYEPSEVVVNVRKFAGKMDRDRT